jgi:hypothetical protein
MLALAQGPRGPRGSDIHDRARFARGERCRTSALKWVIFDTILSDTSLDGTLRFARVRPRLETAANIGKETIA